MLDPALLGPAATFALPCAPLAPPANFVLPSLFGPITRQPPGRIHATADAPAAVRSQSPWLRECVVGLSGPTSQLQKSSLGDVQVIATFIETCWMILDGMMQAQPELTTTANSSQCRLCLALVTFVSFPSSTHGVATA